MPRHYGLPGKVYLAGAGPGPGPAKQLPARTIEVLQGADVVFHDEQVSEEVLGLIPARAAVQNAEKLSGLLESSREELRKRILHAAQSGQTVVLLRGANASILDRSREEIAELFHAGILFETIPGEPASAAAQATPARDKQQEIVLQLPPRTELLPS
jgi:siroheme synthase